MRRMRALAAGLGLVALINGCYLERNARLSDDAEFSGYPQFVDVDPHSRSLTVMLRYGSGPNRHQVIGTADSVEDVSSLHEFATFVQAAIDSSSELMHLRGRRVEAYTQWTDGHTALDDADLDDPRRIIRVNVSSARVGERTYDFTRKPDK